MTFELPFRQPSERAPAVRDVGLHGRLLHRVLEEDVARAHGDRSIADLGSPKVPVARSRSRDRAQTLDRQRFTTGDCIFARPQVLDFCKGQRPNLLLGSVF